MPIETLISAVKRWAERTFATRADVDVVHESIDRVYSDVDQMFVDYVPRIADGSVVTASIADGSVTSDKLSEFSVTSANTNFYIGNWNVAAPNILENECGILLESYRLRHTNDYGYHKPSYGVNRYNIAFPVYGYGTGFVVPDHAKVIVDGVAAVKVFLEKKYHPDMFGYVISTSWGTLDSSATMSNDSVVEFKFYTSDGTEVPMVGKPCWVSWTINTPTEYEAWYRPNIEGIIEHVNGYTDTQVSALDSRLSAIESTPNAEGVAF